MSEEKVNKHDKAREVEKAYRAVKEMVLKRAAGHQYLLVMLRLGQIVESGTSDSAWCLLFAALAPGLPCL